MDYRVLGPLEVSAGGQGIQLPGLKERALLGLLIVEAGTIVSSDRIVYELWGDETPSDAPAALRTHVSRLRKALGDSSEIVTQRPGYVLDTAVSNIDIVRFERLADSAAKYLHRPDEAARYARAAIAEWRGAALSDLETFEFAATEARRLEARRLTTLSTAIDSELSTGRHEAVIPELHALTAKHPYNEVFWSQLMLALYRSGRAGEALEVYRMAESALGESLGIAPSARLRSLEEAIVMDEDALNLSIATPNNLPYSVSQFIGRSGELDALEETMRRSRIVTMTGVGGSGKSRLAIEAARRQLDTYTDGVWRVELAPVRDPATVAQMVAAALGEPASHASDPIRSLVEYIADQRVLLVLDNCEHLLEEVAGLVAQLAEGCPHLTVLATSREALHISGETVWLVNPLDMPELDSSAAEQEEAEAFRLFVSRAQSSHPPFGVADDNRMAITRVCRALAGLPLAIELAAARSAMFTPAQLYQRLQDGIDVLDVGSSGVTDRYRTMRGSLEWSFRLLDKSQAAVLVRLAVFRGGWDLDDAIEIVGNPNEDTAGLLVSLVEKSLVVRDSRLGNRYRLLEPIREYAKEMFQSSREAEAVRSRHSQHFLEVAQHADSLLKGHDQRRWLDRLEADHDNLRKAIEWSIAADEVEMALELVAACGWFWFMNGHWQESWEWLTRALEAAGERAPELRAKAVYTTGALQLIRVNIEPALPLVEEALVICQETGDTYGEAWCLHLIGHTWMYGSDTDPSLMERAREIFVDLNRPWEVAWSDRYIGDAIGIEGDIRTGVELQLRSISAFRELGDRWSTAFGLHNVAGLLQFFPEYGPSAAVPYYERCIRVAEDIGDRVWAAHGVRGLSGCAYQLGQANAEELLTEAIGRLRQIGDENCLSTALGFLGDLQRQENRPAEAAANLAAALRIRYRLSNPMGVALNLIRLGLLAHSQDMVDDAVYLTTAADPIARAWGPRVPSIHKQQHEELISLVARLDDPVDLEDAVPFALELADMLTHKPEMSV